MEVVAADLKHWRNLIINVQYKMGGIKCESVSKAGSEKRKCKSSGWHPSLSKVCPVAHTEHLSQFHITS